MRNGVIPDSPLTSQGFNGSEEPSFVFLRGQNDSARNVASLRLRALLQLRGYFSRAILITVEQDDDGSTVWLNSRQLNRTTQPGFLDELAALPTNGGVDIQCKSLGLVAQPPQQDRDCRYLTVPLDNRLNVHAKSSSKSVS